MSKHLRRWVAGIAVAVAVWLIGALVAPSEGSGGILYRVTDGRNTLYLLGSIHVGSREMYPFGTAIREAMAASDTFVYECDTVSDAAVAAVRERMALQDGQTLEKQIGETLYGLLREAAEKTGLSMDALDTLKPWAVVNTLAVYTTSAEIGADNVNAALSMGVEKQVQAYATANPKRTAYLETPDEQVDVLESFSNALTRYLLQSECDVILHPENAKGMDATIAQWPEWWRAGDAQAFANRYLSAYLEPGYETESAEYHSKLVTERNQRMAERLSALMAQGNTCFATVGLLHLVLPQDSILNLLRAKGYTVEQLSNP